MFFFSIFPSLSLIKVPPPPQPGQDGPMLNTSQHYSFADSRQHGHSSQKGCSEDERKQSTTISKRSVTVKIYHFKVVNLSMHSKCYPPPPPPPPAG